MIGRRLFPGVLLCAIVAGACDTRGLAYGDPNSIIAVMTEERWEDVADAVYEALETTIVTVRNEKMFTVTYQEPYAEYWTELRRFRQMLLVGTASDPWIQEAIERADEPIDSPGVHQIQSVWSRGQMVTLVLLSDESANDELLARLPEIHGILNGQYRDYARNRMYMTGPDSALADTLSTEAGFALLVPKVYRWMATDSTYVFRNDNPDPSELIRQIGVTWMSPAPATLEPEAVLRWRAEVVDDYYSEPQELVQDEMAIGAAPYGGNEALEIRAQWRNPPDRGWPAGGPTITRAVTCDAQDRTYLIDAWLYAPGKEKYEYMIQLETILDTFSCG